MGLVPVRSRDTVEWKIWVWVTVLNRFEVYPEDESLLRSPGRSLNGLATVETDVFIIGGGNA